MHLPLNLISDFHLMMPPEYNLKESEIALNELKPMIIDLLKLFRNQAVHAHFENLMQIKSICQFQGWEYIKL